MSIDSRKTPYYLIDLEKIEASYLAFKKAVKSVGRSDIIAYSIKANYNPAIIEQLHNLGAYFEVCSDYEYNLILNYGISTSHIIVNGCFYNDFSKYNDSILIFDTYTQLSQWVQKGSKEKIGIRVNLDNITVDKRFKNKKSRFGIQFQSSKVRKLLKMANLNNIICLHCHLSGNNREPSIYKDVILQLQSIREEYELKGVRCFDIGGGFKTGKGNDLWNYSDYVNAVNEVCEKDIQLVFEPGNSLVRNCAEYHTEIIDVKRVDNKDIFVVDGSSLHIPKVSFYKTGFHFECSDKSRKQHLGTRIYGNTCKESDLLIELDKPTSLKVGDCLIIENIGAYSLNEINPLILGNPNLYFSNYSKHIIGNHVFIYLCKYEDCYNQKSKNDYSIIRKKATGKGLYAFINKSSEIIYIGVAYNQELHQRIVQHFRKDSGGLRKKLIVKKDIVELENSRLYICNIDDNKQNLLFEKAYLIGLYRPKFNYI